MLQNKLQGMNLKSVFTALHNWKISDLQNSLDKTVKNDSLQQKEKKPHTLMKILVPVYKQK